MVQGIIKTLVLSTSVLSLQLNTHAEIIAAWSFNSSPPDPIPLTGTLTPDTGAGTAFPVGGVRTLYHLGSAIDTVPDDSSWGMFGFPNQETGNKSAGAGFRVSTVGYGNLNIQFHARTMPNASRYARLQYSIDGIEFVDLARLDLGSSNEFLEFSHHLIGVPDAENNPEFAFRMVTEFERTSELQGDEGYVASATNGYSTHGLIRWDEVVLSGEPLHPSNNPPTISSIESFSILENGMTEPLTFVLDDMESPAEELRLIVTSSDTRLLPPDSIHIEGTGSQRTVTAVPRPGSIGATTIHLLVLDPQGRSSSTRLVLTVVSRNTPPTISSVALQQASMGESSESIPFTVGDLESSQESLVVSGHSSNPRLVRSIDLTGAGAERVATIVPERGEIGTAVITLRVTDGRDFAETRFPLVVTAAPDLLLYESFDYPDGELVGSSLVWTPHSGITPIELISGKARLEEGRSQDATIALVGGAYEEGALYAGFTVNFDELPSLAGSYFAHFNAASFRARIFAHTANAAPGLFRLGVSNGAGTRGEWPGDLSLNTPYRIVIRFDTAQGQTALWIDPVDESDPRIEATDTPTASSVTAVGLRQNSGVGDLTVDELKVGTRFDAVVAEETAALAILRTPDPELRLSWPTGRNRYALESSPNVIPKEWTAVSESPEAEAGRWVIRISDAEEPRLFRLVRL